MQPISNQMHSPSSDQYSPSPVSDTLSRRSSGSAPSYRSYLSQSTIPTEYDYVASKTEQTQKGDHRTWQSFSPSPDAATSQISVATCASTTSSLPLEDGRPSSDIHLPEFRPDDCYNSSVPTTPADFHQLFPSARKLTISHDESTTDGNMNLLVNTQIRTISRRTQQMTLFHLRMYDLTRREFSLRRYDRNSGREVCHSVGKYYKPSDIPRPGLQKKISNAFALLRSKSDTRMSNFYTRDQSKKNGSSQRDFGSESGLERPKSSGHDSRSNPQTSTDTIELDFSNYAHVVVKRAGTKAHRRYDVEYWGVKYHWRRLVLRDGDDEQVTYHLTRTGDSEVLAKIVPEPTSPLEQRREELKGAWVPRCAMWISDESVLQSQDVSDVVVACGLVALADDCIRRHFGNDKSKNGLSVFGRQNRQQSPEHPCPSGASTRTSVAGASPTRNSLHVKFAGGR